MKKLQFTRLVPSGQYEMSITDFKDLRGIGAGAYSQVICAKAKKDHKIHAIKKFDKKQIIKLNLLQSLKNEIQVLYALAENPYTVRIFNHFEDANSIYLLLEYVNSGTLYSKLQKDRKFPEAETLSYTKQLVDALEFMHFHRVIHRDVKSENILLKKNEKKVIILKLCDFGWSTLHETLQPLHGGTAEYMAPEVIMQQPYTYSADVWSLGIVIYEMLTGKTPFEPTAQQLRNKKKHEVLQKNIMTCTYTLSASIPAAAKDLLALIFKLDPEQRITIPQIKEHWWLTGKSRPTNQSAKVIYESVLELEDNDTLQVEEIVVPQPIKTKQEIQSSIDIARTSMIKKIKKHQRQRTVSKEIKMGSTDTQVILMQCHYDQIRNQLNSIKEENKNLLGSLQMLSQDTSHFASSGRESVINYTNFDSVHRQGFYRIQQSKLPLLKSEKFCLKQTIEQQLEQLNTIKVATEESVKYQKEFDNLQNYKGELIAVQQTLQKQIKEAIEKKNFMFLEIGNIQQQKLLENKLNTLQNQRIDIDQQFVLALDDFHIDQQGISQRLTISRQVEQDKLTEQVENEFKTQKLNFDQLQVKLNRNYQDKLKQHRARKEQVLDEIDQNKQSLEHYTQDLDQTLKAIQQQCQYLSSEIDSFQELENQMQLKTQSQEESIAKLSRDLQCLRMKIESK